MIAKGDAGAAQFSRDSRQLFFLQRRRDGGHDLLRLNVDGLNVDGTAPARLTDGQADVTGFALSPQAAKP